MNTRGLTELIVLNLALELGVISEALFAMLVLMAIVTTFMAGPALKLLDPNNELGAPVEEELEEAREESRGSSPRSRAGAVDPRGPAVRRRVPAAAGPGGAAGALGTAARADPGEARAAAARRGGARRPPDRERAAAGGTRRRSTAARHELIGRGIAARAVAFVSAEPGRTTSPGWPRREEIDLVLIDGRRPLLGEGVPRGDVGTVLRRGALRRGRAGRARATRRSMPGPTAGRRALRRRGARLGGARARRVDRRGHGRAAEPAGRRRPDRGPRAGVAPARRRQPARPAVRRHHARAGRRRGRPRRRHRGRRRGRGPARGRPVRSLARGGPRRRPARRSPARRRRRSLFVRRGTRPGALAPREDVTRFSWSPPASAPTPRTASSRSRWRRSRTTPARAPRSKSGRPHGPDPQAPPGQPDPLAHPHETEAPHAPSGSKPRPSSRTSTATTVVRGRAGRAPPRLGVLDDVGQRFLDNPVDGALGLGRQPLDALQLRPDWSTGRRRAALGERLDRRAQSHVVEGGGPQLGDQAAQRADLLRGLVDRQLDRTPQRGVVRAASAEDNSIPRAPSPWSVSSWSSRAQRRRAARRPGCSRAAARAPPTWRSSQRWRRWRDRIQQLGVDLAEASIRAGGSTRPGPRAARRGRRGGPDGGPCRDTELPQLPAPWPDEAGLAGGQHRAGRRPGNRRVERAPRAPLARCRPRGRARRPLAGRRAGRARR